MGRGGWTNSAPLLAAGIFTLALALSGTVSGESNNKQPTALEEGDPQGNGDAACFADLLMVMLCGPILIIFILILLLVKFKTPKRFSEFLSKGVREPEIVPPPPPMIDCSFERKRPDLHFFEKRDTAVCLEKSGRLEEAAILFEDIHFYRDAGRCRGKARSRVMKHIHGDIDRLSGQLSRNGLGLPRKCPSCGGPIGGRGDMCVCPYCGSTVDFETLREGIKMFLL